MDGTADMDTRRCIREKGILGDSSCPKLPEVGHCRVCPDYLRAGKRLFEREIPETWLDEWAELYAGMKETERRGSLVLVVFRVGEEWLALPAVDFLEVITVRPVHFVPFRSGLKFRGLVNVNGELLPCVSLMSVIGAESGAGDGGDRNGTGRMVMVGRGGDRYVFAVDEVLGIRRFPPEDVQSPPSTISRAPSALTIGVIEMEGKTVGVFDSERLFAALKGSVRF